MKLDRDPSEVDSLQEEKKAEESHILQIRDYMLDLEERIYTANFGDAAEDDNERKLVS